LSNFYKIKGGGGCPRFVTSRQISPLSLLKCGLTAPKIGNFWYKFAQKGYTPLSNFLYKIWLWESLTGLHPHTKFYRRDFKNVSLQPPKSQKLVIFGIYLPEITKFGVGRVSYVPTIMLTFTFKSVALQPPKSPKIAIFGINLPLRKNPGGP